jgi:hypothetical protein
MMQSLKTVVLLAAFVAFPATAGEEIKEMSMATDVGEVVLTLERCPIASPEGFDYYGYATEQGNQDHPGCWGADNEIVQIWFINENVIGIYKKTLFKPRLKV